MLGWMRSGPGRLPLLRVRGFSTEAVYAEQLQLKQIKRVLRPPCTRSHLLLPRRPPSGQLFLEDTMPKTIATSLKSHSFLRFFFGQLRPNPNAGKMSSLFHDYSYTSPCGSEMNYIKAADTPFVFSELKADDKGDWTLVTNAGQAVRFDPSHLAMSTATHRLYHWLQTKHVSLFALLRSQVAVEVSQTIDFRENGHHVVQWKGGQVPLTLDTSRPPLTAQHLKILD
ncbi:hypothetical protein H310_00481 [Aphanomyces invadans]|uniref:Uncharacterized protein n=1 Tax=Aphanomyces invadans TaxID=157072 RepID=A0A024UUT1_9STRA|nr:hypothetical protein H310_00481 [Aphanomyces invadans]ETW10104.1 hypothetical protein H310_00481 [Aphanomyces invadans]|eukprot:XP_008861515.1 hypothetical protein H310_00481 [Aphanomyces invadans]